jgi:hypothetical protein
VCLVSGCDYNNTKTYYAFTPSAEECIEGVAKDRAGKECKFKPLAILEIRANADTQMVNYKLEYIDSTTLLEAVKCEVFSADDFKCLNTFNQVFFQNIDGKLSMVLKAISASSGLYHAEKYLGYEYKGDWGNAYYLGKFLSAIKWIVIWLGAMFLASKLFPNG